MRGGGVGNEWKSMEAKNVEQVNENWVYFEAKDIFLLDIDP